MATTELDAQSRIVELINMRRVRVSELIDVAEKKRVKLEQCVRLRMYEGDARQVNNGCSGRYHSNGEGFIIYMNNDLRH